MPFLSQIFINQDYDAQDLKDFEETIMQGVGYDAHGKICRKVKRKLNYNVHQS